MTANEDKPRANPIVVLREEFDDWAVLFDPDTGRGFGLNHIGVYVWKLLDGEHTLDGLFEEVRHRTEGAPEEAAGQVTAFVDDLVAEGLAAVDRTPRRPVDTSGRPLVQEGRPSSSRGPQEVARDRTLGGTATKIPYEKPWLIDFRNTDAAYGDCGRGSIASGGGPAGDCHPGVAAGHDCNTNGSTASNQCHTYGSQATSTCSMGSYAAPCSAGGSP